jgi:hypothetical protein
MVYKPRSLGKMPTLIVKLNKIYSTRDTVEQFVEEVAFERPGIQVTLAQLQESLDGRSVFSGHRTVM